MLLFVGAYVFWILLRGELGVYAGFATTASSTSPVTLKQWIASFLPSWLGGSTLPASVSPSGTSPATVLPGGGNAMYLSPTNQDTSVVNNQGSEMGGTNSSLGPGNYNPFSPTTAPTSPLPDIGTGDALPWLGGSS